MTGVSDAHSVFPPDSFMELIIRFVAMDVNGEPVGVYVLPVAPLLTMVNVFSHIQTHTHPAGPGVSGSTQDPLTTGMPVLGMRVIVRTIMFGFFFSFPKVQRLISMVLMRSRCNQRGQKELGQGESGWRSKVWQVPSQPAWRSCPGIHTLHPPPQYSQSTRSLLGNMYSARTVSKQWKLPTAVIYWAPLSTGSVGGLKGFHCSNERFEHKSIPVSFSYLWIWSVCTDRIRSVEFSFLSDLKLPASHLSAGAARLREAPCSAWELPGWT